jgi:multidrug resistance efflux pump
MKRFRLHKPSLRGWIVIGIIVLVCLVAYYELVCHFTPFTRDAYLQAFVVQIAPQVAGWVTAVHVSNNSSVRKGEELFDIDPRPYRYAVDRLEATIVQTRQQVAQLTRKKQRLTDLIRQRKAELAFAQEDFNKIEVLEKEGAYSQIKRDRALSLLNEKRALLGEAEEAMAEVEEALKARIGGEHATIKEVRANLQRAQFDLAHTKVCSPADGYVSNLQLTAGSYVKIGDPVLTVIDRDTWWIVANFKENAMSRIRKGQPAEISLRMFPGYIFQGRVLSADWGVKVGQGEPCGILPDIAVPKNWVKPLQRFPVRLEIEDFPKAFPRRVGTTATVTIYTQHSRIFNGLSHLWLVIASYLDYLY